MAPGPIELAERVAQVAHSLRVETTLIGAYAMAAYGYVRGTQDIDLASATDLDGLRRVEAALIALGLGARLLLPDADDPLGGKLVVWAHVDEDGEPREPVEVVNFLNPFRPRRTPAPAAIASAIKLEGMEALRYPQLDHLIALKMYAGGLRDHADVVELLHRNPDADLERIRRACKDYGFDQIEALITHARQVRS